MKKIIVVLGPTATGKSDLAIKIAKGFGGEIISADSRQIYRDMNLGTGKVEGEWRKILNSKEEIENKNPVFSFQFPVSSKIDSALNNEEKKDFVISDKLFPLDQNEKNLSFRVRPNWRARNLFPVKNEANELNSIKSAQKGISHPSGFEMTKENSALISDKILSKAFFSEGIPHHLVDFVDPRDEYNVVHFKEDCNLLIRQIQSRGKIPIICGGTGFWISAVVDGLDLPKVEPNLKLREELEKLSAEMLFEKLGKIDPERAKTIDPKNKIRLIRALEICSALGKVPKSENSNARQGLKCKPVNNTTNSKFQIPLSGTISNFLISSSKIGSFLNLKLFKNLELKIKNFQDRLAFVPQSGTTTDKQPASQFLLLGLDYPIEVLSQRIEKRLQNRWKARMLEEIIRLKEKYDLSWEKLESFGLVYFWAAQFLKEKINRQEMEYRCYLAERHYAKRQKTWFRRDERILWENNEDVVFEKVKKFLN